MLSINIVLKACAFDDERRTDMIVYLSERAYEVFRRQSAYVALLWRHIAAGIRVFWRRV